MYIGFSFARTTLHLGVVACQLIKPFSTGCFSVFPKSKISLNYQDKEESRAGEVKTRLKVVPLNYSRQERERAGEVKKVGR